MKARILKKGIRYEPQIYTERWGWTPYNDLYETWSPNPLPKQFWTKGGAEKLLDSLKEFDI